MDPTLDRRLVGNNNFVVTYFVTCINHHSQLHERPERKQTLCNMEGDPKEIRALSSSIKLAGKGSVSHSAIKTNHPKIKNDKVQSSVKSGPLTISKSESRYASVTRHRSVTGIHIHDPIKPICPTLSNTHDPKCIPNVSLEKRILGISRPSHDHLCQAVYNGQIKSARCLLGSSFGPPRGVPSPFQSM